MPIYCGNNKHNNDLTNGRKTKGTRYKCLQKGIGIGLNMPKDNDYAGRYSPISKDKIYCGTDRRKPADYDRLGSLSSCLQKGIGVGKRQVAMRFFGYDFELSENFIVYMIFVVIIHIIIFIKFRSIIKKYEKKIIDELEIKKKLLIIYLIILICLIVIYKILNSST